MSVIQKVLNCCIHVSTLCQSNSNSRIHNLDTYNISYMQLGYSCGSITVKIIVTRINIMQLSPMYCICSCNKSSPTGTTWEPDCGLDFFLLLMRSSFCGRAGAIGLHCCLLLLPVFGTLGGCVGATSSAYRLKMHACLAMYAF